MIEVKLQLFGSKEVELVTRAYAEIERQREAAYDAEVKDIMGEGKMFEPAPTDQISGFPSLAERDATLADARASQIQAEERAALERNNPSEDLLGFPKTVTSEQMETAVKAYAASKGMPAARALLDEFKVQRVGEVTGEQRAALYARLTA